MNNKLKAFTFIELLLVVLIITIIFPILYFLISKVFSFGIELKKEVIYTLQNYKGNIYFINHPIDDIIIFNDYRNKYFIVNSDYKNSTDIKNLVQDMLSKLEIDTNKPFMVYKTKTNKLWFIGFQKMKDENEIKYRFINSVIDKDYWFGNDWLITFDDLLYFFKNNISKYNKIINIYKQNWLIILDNIIFADKNENIDINTNIILNNNLPSILFLIPTKALYFCKDINCNNIEDYNNIPDYQEVFKKLGSAKLYYWQISLYFYTNVWLRNILINYLVK